MCYFHQLPNPIIVSQVLIRSFILCDRFPFGSCYCSYQKQWKANSTAGRRTPIWLKLSSHCCFVCKIRYFQLATVIHWQRDAKPPKKKEKRKSTITVNKDQWVVKLMWYTFIVTQIHLQMNLLPFMEAVLCRRAVTHLFYVMKCDGAAATISSWHPQVNHSIWGSWAALNPLRLTPISAHTCSKL